MVRPRALAVLRLMTKCVPLPWTLLFLGLATVLRLTVLPGLPQLTR